jgi:hypothetical protein
VREYEAVAAFLKANLPMQRNLTLPRRQRMPAIDQQESSDSCASLRLQTWQTVTNADSNIEEEGSSGAVPTQ